MATMVEFIAAIVTRENDRTKQYGEVNRPTFISADGDIKEVTTTLAASASATLYNGTTDPFTTCAFIWVRSEYDAAIELTCDTANTYGTTRATLYLEGSGEAGEFGPPVMLANAQMYANYTAAFAAGTLCGIDKVMVKNLDTTNTNKIEFFCGE
jgi:hypothetical protein